jgi:hypothetical protein
MTRAAHARFPNDAVGHGVLGYASYYAGVLVIGWECG